MRRMTALTKPERTGAVDLPREGHRLVDRGVGGHAHAEQLVGSEPQGVEDTLASILSTGRPAAEAMMAS